MNIPFIAVPLPTSKDNHQFENANFYRNNNCCWIIEQNCFDAKIEDFLKNILINQDRLWDSLMTMAKIGPGIAGGNNRQTVTLEDGEARELLQKWSEEAGMNMKVDELGSMFLKREGTDKNALPVVIGSHLDTQPTGGKYDGVLGVLAGLEIVRTLNDLNIQTKHPIMIVNWTNEEGSRFPPAMMASAGYAGI